MSAAWAIRIGLLVPAVALAALAIPRLGTGLRLEEAFPATAYIATNTPLPATSYRDVAHILAGAPAGDSETNLLQAEAALNAGSALPGAVPQVKGALANSPLSARGWIILASLWTNSDRAKAAKALAFSLALAPREYYLTLPAMLVGAPLWSALPTQARAELLQDVRELADDRERRGQLRLLMARPAGADLVVRAFSGRPEALRQLNRDLAREKLGL